MMSLLNCFALALPSWLYETKDKMMEQSDHQKVAQLAYRYWQERGSPIGSPAEDWFRAEADLHRTERPDQIGIFAFAMEPTERLFKS